MANESCTLRLSETREELEAVADSHHWSMEGISFFELTPREEMLKPEYQYSAFHPSEIELHDTTQNILEQLGKVQPSRVVIDSLSQIRLLARDSLRYRRQILGLKSFFAQRNCTPMLLEERATAVGEEPVRAREHRSWRHCAGKNGKSV